MRDGARPPTGPDRGITVRVRQDAPIPLDISLSCAAGELVALVGPSGAGKSTILRAIAGLYRPKDGQITCGDRVWFDARAGVELPPHKRAVGLVFQSYALFPHMTALGNVMAALGHRPRQEREKRARELLHVVHLAGLEQRRPCQLSGGQQQRVAVARALAREPAILLMDEPFSAVDRRTRRRLHAELKELRQSVLHVPVVLVTHDLEEAAGLADRLVVIDQGAIVQAGSPAEVMAAPASERVREILDLPALADTL